VLEDVLDETGTVTVQDPAAETSVAAGSTVTLTLTLTEEMPLLTSTRPTTTTPPATPKTPITARAATPTSTPTPTPTPAVTPESPAPVLVIVPQVRGLTVRAADAALHRVGLARGGDEPADPDGRVDRQTPAAGTPVPSGSRIAITLASASTPLSPSRRPWRVAAIVVLVFLLAVAASVAAATWRRRRTSAADRRNVRPYPNPAPPARAWRSHRTPVGRLNVRSHCDTAAQVQTLSHGDRPSPALGLRPRPDHRLDAVLMEVSR
jgi:hypothetical protein